MFESVLSSRCLSPLMRDFPNMRMAFALVPPAAARGHPMRGANTRARDSRARANAAGEWPSLDREGQAPPSTAADGHASRGTSHRSPHAAGVPRRLTPFRYRLARAAAGASTCPTRVQGPSLVHAHPFRMRGPWRRALTSASTERLGAWQAWAMRRAIVQAAAA
jgi:hypothetical protein